MGLKEDISQRLALIELRNKKPKKKPYEGNGWPLEKKMEAVECYLRHGNLKQVSLQVGVNYNLMRKWHGQPWWAEIEAELRKVGTIKTDNKLTTIADKALDATLDRVENGDYVFDPKTKKIHRVPASLRDVNRVAVDMLSKQEALRQNDKTTESSKISVEEHLKMLANEMAKWFEKDLKPVIELEEVEDAVYEEREERLQEGTGVGTHQEAESSEGSSGEEYSSESDGRRRQGA